MPRVVASVAGAFVLATAPIAAKAFTVDFTSSVFAGDFSHTYSDAEIAGGPLTVSLASTPAGRLTAVANGLSATERTGVNAAAADAGVSLALDFDGIGVRDDEVQNPESIVVSFSRTVQIATVFLLDFFNNPAGSFEIAFLNGGDLVGGYTFNATARPGSGGFFAEDLVPSLIADSIVFTAPRGVGDDGNIDYALAALELSVVPLPASVLLLIGALGCFALLSRRREA